VYGTTGKRKDIVSGTGGRQKVIAIGAQVAAT
jgi:hypothetical protein